MESEWSINPINLNELIVKKIKEEDEEQYSKIEFIKSTLKLDENIEGRYSISFLLDLLYGFESSTINIDAVMHEVNFLEGLNDNSKTKEQSQFRRPPLQGLWHKHYEDTSLSGLAMNVKNALNSYSIPYFEEKIIEARESGEERYMTAEDIKYIVNDAVSGNLQKRRGENKMTGEWIVYASYEGKKYYLCLAKHNHGDDFIRKKIDNTGIYEFPFLSDVLVESSEISKKAMKNRP